MSAPAVENLAVELPPEMLMPLDAAERLYTYQEVSDKDMYIGRWRTAVSLAPFLVSQVLREQTS